MKILTIKHTERMGLPNYSHYEMSGEAQIEEGEDAYSAMLSLKTMISAALTGKIAEVKEAKLKTAEEIEAAQKPKVEEVAMPQGIQHPVGEAIKEDQKTRKPRTTKPKTEEVKEEVKAEVVEEVKKEVVAVKYDRGQDAHKSMLSAYLTKTFADWKTKHPKQKIIDFNSSLHGKDFLNTNGNIIESFKELLTGFYA